MKLSILDDVKSFLIARGEYRKQMSFPEVMKAVREYSGKTQCQLADEIAVSESTVRRIEQGRPLLSDELGAIDKALQCKGKLIDLKYGRESFCIIKTACANRRLG